jgi:hypothetical protein
MTEASDIPAPPLAHAFSLVLDLGAALEVGLLAALSSAHQRWSH